MAITFYIFTILFTIVSLLPLVRNKRWFFRIWEFGYIQLTVLQFLTLIIGFWAVQENNIWFIGAVLLLSAGIIYHIWLLLPFTPVYKLLKKQNKFHGKESETVAVLSVNVYQPNTSYKKLLDLVDRYHPDLIFAMETDDKWEKGLQSLEQHYHHQIKIPLKNTYGMLLYSRLKIINSEINYFTSEDIPSITCTVETNDGFQFKFYGIHPPPPSPTEEETSKERDGEMMTIAKIIRNRERDEIVVIGDFNNVAWATSSRRFRRISGLLDPRFGRGLVSTFHAKYPMLRIPIDLMFHGEKILIKDFKRTTAIDSDHFPLYCSFSITQHDAEETTEHAEKEDLKEMEKDIQEGLEENGEREDLD